MFELARAALVVVIVMKATAEIYMVLAK